MENQEQIVNSVSELTQEQRVNAFAEAIKRSTSQIKADRALEVSELLELEMKREVEDRTRDKIFNFNNTIGIIRRHIQCRFFLSFK